MIIDINYSDSIYNDGDTDNRIDKDLICRAANLIVANELFGEINARNIFLAEQLPGYIGLSIVSDEEIKEINSEFRGIDKVTDVLSFPQYENLDDICFELENNEENIDLPIGDVVICLDRAEKQSKEYGTTIKREIIYLFVHSIMHLLGYDHIDEKDKKIMREHEEIIMNELGIKKIR